MSQCWVLYKLGGEGFGGNKSKGTYKEGIRVILGWGGGVKQGIIQRDHTKGLGIGVGL